MARDVQDDVLAAVAGDEIVGGSEEVVLVRGPAGRLRLRVDDQRYTESMRLGVQQREASPERRVGAVVAYRQDADVLEGAWGRRRGCG
jgi:hypothetical protein